MKRQSNKTNGLTSSPSPVDSGSTKAVRFINNLSHTGDFAGQPFCLRPWQERIVRELFRTRADGLRQHRQAFLALPRKQGKTELAAAILLYLLLGTGNREQQIYSASGDRAQAALIFRAAAAMVRNEPALSDVCNVYDGYKRITCEPLGSFYEALSSDAPRKHGLGPSAVLFDEVHVLPNRDLHDVLTTGFAARRDPLTLYITTAGWDRNSLCYELWQRAEQIRDGSLEDPGFLPILYGAGPEDDWTDEGTWRKAMPALGDFCSVEFIRSECKRAQETPAYENTFRQLYLNQWTEQASRWLQVERWAKCGSLARDWSPEGECYAGLDLGVTGDMSAFARVFPNEQGGCDVAVRFWVPREGRWRNESRNKDLYKQWERAGFLTFTAGESADFDQIEQEIVALLNATPCKALFADRAFATQMLSRLFNSHGIPVKGITQGPVQLNEAMVRIESMIIDGTLRHNGDPVLAWNVANASVEVASTGLMHLHKGKSTARIDGLAAVIDAVAAMIADPSSGESVYESRGLICI